MPGTVIDPPTPALSDPAALLAPGARIVIGRYLVEVLAAPCPVLERAYRDPEVRLLVRDVAGVVAGGGLWNVSVGAGQRFPLVLTSAGGAW